MITIKKLNDFDNLAVTWDQVPGRVQVANDIGKAILETVKLNSGMDVLDFGCGTGLLTLQLQPYVRSITGMDSSPGMLEALNSKITGRGLSNIKIKWVDFEQGDIFTEQYSLVVSSMTLHHIKDVKLLLEYFHRILIPGGQLCIADLDSDDGQFHESGDGVYHFGFERPELYDLFCQAGFTDIKDRTAATVAKPGRDGENREFTIFLMEGFKRLKG